MPLEIYEPYGGNKRIEELMARARATNMRRHVADKKSGATPLGETPLDCYIRTAMTAISSGMATIQGADEGSLDCIAEGLAMLQEIEVMVRALLGSEGFPEPRR